MKKSAEKIGQLLNYEKFSNIRLLELPQVKKEDVPSYIQTPKYDKAKGKFDKAMERYNDKVDRLVSEIHQLNADMKEWDYQYTRWKSKATPIFGVNEDNVDKVNAAISKQNHYAGLFNKGKEKLGDLEEKLNDAQEEAKEKLEELTLEALAVIDEDIAMVFNRLESIISKQADSEVADDLLAAIDMSLVGLRIYAMFDDLIDDSSARKECKENIAKINQIFSNLCSEDSIQGYMVDVYRRNLDLVQKNAAINKQIDGILASVDQKQLDASSKLINTVLSETYNTNFDYNSVIDPAEIDRIVVNIQNTIASLKQGVEKAKALQAPETPAIELGKAGVKADQEAKSLRASMQTNVDALDGPLTQNHFAVQMIDETVIEDFYQKDLRVAVTALRKHIIDTLGEQNFESVLKGGDDRFSLKKGQNAIDKANLSRLQATLDKITPYINGLTGQISSAEADIQKANEVPKRNADALNVELGKKFGLACIPAIGFIFAIGAGGRVKTYETAFCGGTQIYKDLGNSLIEKAKKMAMVALIVSAVLGVGSLIPFLIIGGPWVISAIVLATGLISFLVLSSIGKRLIGFVGETVTPIQPQSTPESATST